MSRKFDFNKDRIGLLAGLIEEDSVDDVRHSLAEEYHRELVEDMKEVDETQSLEEYTNYMGYKPEDSEGEQGVDCECPEKAKPDVEGLEEGLPGWEYYEADPTYSKISTMKHDLQHKKRLQWDAPLASELGSGDGYEDMQAAIEEDEDINEADARRLLRAKINGMISDYELVSESSSLIVEGEKELKWVQDTKLGKLYSIHHPQMSARDPKWRAAIAKLDGNQVKILMRSGSDSMWISVKELKNNFVEDPHMW